MKLTDGERKIVEDMQDGWRLEGHTAWDRETHKYIPYGMRLLRGADVPYGEFKRVHQGITRRMHKKGIIRCKLADLYFTQWELSDVSTESNQIKE